MVRVTKALDGAPDSVKAVSPRATHEAHGLTPTTCVWLRIIHLHYNDLRPPAPRSHNILFDPPL